MTQTFRYQMLTLILQLKLHMLMLKWLLQIHVFSGNLHSFLLKKQTHVDQTSFECLKMGDPHVRD